VDWIDTGREAIKIIEDGIDAMAARKFASPEPASTDVQSRLFELIFVSMNLPDIGVLDFLEHMRPLYKGSPPVIVVCLKTYKIIQI
jgi:hypothetical protein